MKRVEISELKAKLASFLRLVKSGESVLICEHSSPIAVLTKYENEDFEVQEPVGHPMDVLGPIIESYNSKDTSDSTQILIEDRGRR